MPAAPRSRGGAVHRAPSGPLGRVGGVASLLRGPMSRRSLRARLWVGAIASIGLALLVAGIGLVTLFERHVERRIGAELKGQLNQLAAAVELASDGSVGLSREPLEPRFAQPMSGLYWQIDAVDRPGLLRSRSLWDSVLALPPDRLDPGGVHAHELPGPGGQHLLVRERRIILDADGAPVRLRLAVALDRAELGGARDAFAGEMLPYLGLIGLVLVLATFAQIQAGLAPLEAVRRGLEAIRSGLERQLPDHYPDEVMPLVNEVNALLAARALAVERARAWTADLAHGLKSPLSALIADAQRLRAAGNAPVAEDLEQLAGLMRRRVDRELIRARARSGAETHRARVDVVDAVQRLLRTLRRTPDGERCDWLIDAPAVAMVAMMPDDLMDLLGNLLENAAKWADERVWIEVAQGDWVEVSVRDDGPGVPASQLSRLGERGLRLDRHKEGTGLGLAIVRDLLDAYQGDLRLAAAPEGGLLVVLRLPAAP